MHPTIYTKTFNRFGLIFLSCLFSLLSACMSQADMARSSTQAKDFTILRSALTMKLKRQGVQVVEIGETISMRMSSDTLFNGASANLKRPAFSSLDTIADFLNTYSKTFIEVGGYSDACDSKKLTSQQAARVVNYLWPKDLDARMLYGVGYGPKNRQMNSRYIEIRFQYNR